MAEEKGAVDLRKPDDVDELSKLSIENLDDKHRALFIRAVSNSSAIFFHSDRYNVTYCIYQLLASQKQQLLDFLLSNPASTSCPLPILGDKNKVRCIDPEEPIGSTGIYRDPWERKPLPLDAPDMQKKDLRVALDYPT
ncbi:hypothetical protein B0T26DRAFT_674357 [Lasiosphaeria miniovina]|uniref:Uncharacterized protein n=1 Tax=Lasiosphaeria miniovina TaxID=1954250 RepID=A0AA40AVB7_9PEZI|nr:uncharacterized protein B0T26DRAFT_674357 [Lasiosphaeria miniovina]KAK0722680.1 hypothetical protein B0T26DRAFT_674357 [Lasiosphaeria miniovina]